MDHRVGFAVPVPADPVGDEAAVGDERVGAARRAHVPASQHRRDGMRGQTRQGARAAWPEVGVELVPEVPHRRVDVGDVHGASSGAAAFGHRVAGGEHQVVRRQIEGLDGEGKQRQVVAVAALGKPVQEAGEDPVALDDLATRSRHVDEGEDVGLGMEQAELLEHALAPAQAGEPVVDQRHLHRAASR